MGQRRSYSLWAVGVVVAGSVALGAVVAVLPHVPAVAPARSDALADTLAAVASPSPSQAGTTPRATRTPFAPRTPPAAVQPAVPSARPSPTPSAPGQSAAVAPRRYDHVIWIWMENREATAITPASAPYLAGLARAYGLAADYYGVSHPSEPNYIAAVAGSTLGVTDDGVYDLAAPSLFSQLAAAGRTWRVYAQDNPGGCYTGASRAGGIDGPGVAGAYVRKHEPAISFTSVSRNPSACANIRPLRRFSPTAASFELVVPNLTNDMHDGSTATGDAFLRAFVPQILASPDWARTVVVITFDEGGSNAGLPGGRGGRVYTVVVRKGLSHVVSHRAYDHYSLLATTERALGLPLLGAAKTRAPMTDLVP